MTLNTFFKFCAPQGREFLINMPFASPSLHICLPGIALNEAYCFLLIDTCLGSLLIGLNKNPEGFHIIFVIQSNLKLYRPFSYKIIRSRRLGAGGRYHSEAHFQPGRSRPQAKLLRLFVNGCFYRRNKRTGHAPTASASLPWSIAFPATLEHVRILDH
jgi:hypothetical protein